jgi:hypothetical protein
MMRSLPATLDIATFGLSEDELTQIQGTALDCTAQWPPPTPKSMTAVSLAGFPEVMRDINRIDRSAKFRAYVALTTIEDFNDREIFFTFDPARDQPLLDGIDRPPLGFNMSGCSGGPVLMHGMRDGRHRCFPIGIIVKGSGDSPKGEFQEFDSIRARRIHFVQEDGCIEYPQTG